MLKDGFNILARTNGYNREGGECHKSLWQAGIMAFLKIVAKLEKIIDNKNTATSCRLCWVKMD